MPPWTDNSPIRTTQTPLNIRFALSPQTLIPRGISPLSQGLSGRSSRITNLGAKRQTSMPPCTGLNPRCEGVLSALAPSLLGLPVVILPIVGIN